MVTLTQAQTAFGNTRRFFAPGEKSSNKRYFGTGGFFETVTLFAATQGTTKPLTFDAAEARVQRRETNRVLSSRLNTDPSSPPDKPKPVSYPGKTPLEIGQIRVNGGMRSGNCGIMAAVAIYFASLEGVLATDMWHVTATNPTTNSYAPGIWGRNMSFGHSWAKLGTDTTGGPFVVDPWASVVCLETDYPTELRKQLDKWHSQGKRICVGWGDDKAMWTNANDSAILSLLDANTRTLQVIAANQP